MSFYGLPEGTSISSLFGSSSYSNSSSSGSSSILSEYASIKNGSYYKLLKSYYNGNNKVDSLVPNTATSKDEAKKLTKVEGEAEDLKAAADELLKQGSSSVFKKVPIKGENGTTENGYDTNAIYKKVGSFVDSYNSMLESTEDVSSDTLARSVRNLTSATNVNSKMLAKIGISVKSDGSLKLDEDTFKKSDMESVKSLFNGAGSYGYQVSVRASMIDYNAQREAEKANTYNKNGSYSNNYNYSYNSYI